MKQIPLLDLQYEYLITSNFLSKDWKKLLANSHSKINNLYQIQLTEEQCDELRDLLGEQLQIVGFDENYHPTKAGKILETLIDKFFV